LLMPATAFKNAIADVALDMPDVNKTELKRLMYVDGDYKNGDFVQIYGIPELHMHVVRMANAARTPDIRSRPIIPKWACTVSVAYTKPLLREKAVFRALAAAGIIRGVGDWRVEKGGKAGQFEIVPPSDKRWKAIVKTGGIEAQDQALVMPRCYDRESEELLGWFVDEVKDRGFADPANLEELDYTDELAPAGGEE